MPTMRDIPHLLVPFSARRLSNPSAVLRNFDVDRSPDEAWLERYGYCAPRDEDDECHFSVETKTFHAERYGGQGLLTNGGAARCGNDDKFQIKGIGPTPLVGEHTDFWYRHGGASLIEGIREVIWSRIFGTILPYGACRVSGLIDCRTQSWRNVNGEKTLTRRSLIVREVAWRPAHFERSLYFAPTEPYAALLPHDTERCRSSTEYLADLLPLPIGTERDQLKSEGMMLVAGMAELTDRFAAQLSSAREHRLMHGGLSSSNIALDGRFIDFGSASHLPGFANTRNFVPGFWDDHHALLSCLTHMCLYLKKYQAGGGHLLPDPDWLIHRFQQAFATLQARSFVSLAGFPPFVQQALEREQPDLLHAFGQAVLHIAKRGADRPYYGNPSKLAGHGRYRLRDVIVTLLRTHGSASADAAMSQVIPDELDRTNLMRSFHALFPAASAVAQARSIQPLPLRQYAAVTASRRLREIPELFGPTLDKEIEDFLLGFSSHSYIDDASKKLAERRIAQAQSLSRPHDDFVAWADDPLAGLVRFDAKQTKWRDGRASTEGTLCEWIPAGASARTDEEATA